MRGVRQPAHGNPVPSQMMTNGDNRPVGRVTYAKIPVQYFALATAYIVVSTLAFGLYFDYTPRILGVEIAKGVGFVLLTALILWAVLRYQLRSAIRHEARFYQLVENMPDAVLLLCTPERRIVYANPAARRMFGYDADELVGASTAMLHVDDEHFTRFLTYSPPDFSVGDSFSVEYNMRRKNGDVFPTNHIVSLFSGDDGRTYVLGMIRDESERRSYEARVRESEERLRQIAENLREVLWITDPEKEVLYYVNPAYELIWGRSADELYANPRRVFLDSLHAEDRSRVEADTARQVEGDYDIQYRIVRPDGEVRWIWDRAVPITDDDGTITRVVGIAEDVTELRRHEAELRQAQKMEAVGQLTGGIAHDFNNLLTVILGNAESLRDAFTGDPEEQQDLRAIIDASRRAASLTQRLLAFSRQQVLRSDRVDLNALVGDMTTLLRRTLGEQVEIETRLAADLWPITVDRAQLETSIMNLAINARDAMPDGGRLTLATENVTVEPDSGEARAGIAPVRYLRLRVSDTGHGMTQAVAAKVFDPFFTTKEPGKGTGLGLSTVYGFVRQSGGSVSVHSAPGRGAVFDVLLPQDAEAQPAEPHRPEEVREGQPRGGATLLVVEDDPMVRAYTVAQLRMLDYVVLDAGNGHAALEVLDAHEDVELLFTDVVMPGGMSGPELAAEARKRRPELGILFTSGYSEAVPLEHGGRSPDMAFLRKPYTPKQLAHAVQCALDER